MNFIKYTIILLLCFFTLPISSAEITNGYFTDNLSGWDCGNTGNASIMQCERSTSGGWDGSPSARVKVLTEGNPGQSGYCYLTQDVNVTKYSSISFKGKSTVGTIGGDRGGTTTVYIGSNSLEITNNSWLSYEINITGTGVQELKFEAYGWDLDGATWNAESLIYFDNIELTDQYLFTISGYIDNTEGNPVRTYPYLNNSDSTESDDTTGYYEFTGLTEGSYLLSIDGFVYDAYSTVIDISADTEHNITVSRQLPILSTTNINPGKNKMLLTWVRNVVVSDVLIYRGTNTNQISSVSSGSYLTGYYQNENLICETPYTYWLQPMDDDIAGPKYELSDITTNCGAPDVFIPLPPVIPTPTFPPVEDDNETIISDLIEIIIEIIPEPLKELPEKVLEIVEETITYISTPFNWLLLITAYIGAFIGKSIFNDDEDYAEIITSTLLFGTIGWIIILLINFFVPIISQNEMVSILIFTTSGFIIAAIASSIQPETKTRAPRRPHT